MRFTASPGARIEPDPDPVDLGRREFTVVSDGHYQFALPLFGIRFDADRLRWDHHELVGELAVSCEIPGAKTLGDGSLSRANFNFSSLRTRQDLAKVLCSRSNARDFDWAGLLEDLCARALVAERTGHPSVLLREVECPDPAGQHLDVLGLALPRHHAGFLHGPGDTLKSMLTLAIACELQRQGERVGYVDWELDASDHRLRLGRLCGDDLPAIVYIKCDRPLVAEVDRIRRLADDDELTYLMYDSAAFAADGPPEAAEVAARYFRAVRQINRGSLHVAHATKAEGNDSTMPFGSVFWFNGARATWSVSRSETGDPSTVTISVANKKANLGPRRPAVGYEFAFQGDRTHLQRVDVTDVEDLAARLPIRQRVAALLRRGPMSIAELSAALEAREDSVRKAVERPAARGQFFTRVPSADGSIRFGLLHGGRL